MKQYCCTNEMHLEYENNENIASVENIYTNDNFAMGNNHSLGLADDVCRLPMYYCMDHNKKKKSLDMKELLVVQCLALKHHLIRYNFPDLLSGRKLLAIKFVEIMPPFIDLNPKFT
jgi:hypothetical protein